MAPPGRKLVLRDQGGHAASPSQGDFELVSCPRSRLWALGAGTSLGLLALRALITADPVLLAGAGLAAPLLVLHALLEGGLLGERHAASGRLGDDEEAARRLPLLYTEGLRASGRLETAATGAAALGVALLGFLAVPPGPGCEVAVAHLLLPVALWLLAAALGTRAWVGRRWKLEPVARQLEERPRAAPPAGPPEDPVSRCAGSDAEVRFLPRPG